MWLFAPISQTSFKTQKPSLKRGRKVRFPHRHTGASASVDFLKQHLDYTLGWRQRRWGNIWRRLPKFQAFSQPFITQRHAGAAWLSLTAISVLAPPPGGWATCSIWGLIIHKIPAGRKFGLQGPYFPKQVSHNVEGRYPCCRSEGSPTHRVVQTASERPWCV